MTDERQGVAQAAPDAAADATETTESGTAEAGATGPVSILHCAACGAANRIRPSDKGAPHCGSCGKPLPWVVTADEATFDVETRASVGVVVDLWAEWCGPCRMLSPILEQLATEYAGRLKVVKVNVDENQRLAQQHGAYSIPLLLIMQNGRVVDRIVGMQPKSALTMRLMPYLLRR